MLYLVTLALLAVAQARPEPHLTPSLHFTWEDCGHHPLRPLKVHSLSVTPDPVKLPGKALLSFDVESTAEISNMDLKISLKKNTVIGDVEVPCISGVGSCTYKDLCSYIAKIPDPPITCPVAAERFIKNNIEIPLPDPGSLGALLAGKYTVQTDWTETDTGREMGCFRMTLELAV